MRQVRQVLGILINKSLVTLKVHPQDLVMLKPLHEALQAEFLDGNHLIIEGHEDVQPGGCLVEQAGLQLDARLQQQLETVATEFGLEVSPS
jgi:flagellar biosynthesis/type III secretory pathway protein FliH